jgi:galactonate dehydratase
VRRAVTRVTARALRIPRDFDSAQGTAGTPAALGEAAGRYRWAKGYRTVYSDHLETVLVRVEAEGGLVGWGEAQAPVAPEVARAAVDSLLGPLLVGQDALAPEAAWERMYASMRVRGHGGGFLLDAIAALDTALWDLCGKAYGVPLYRLLGGPCRERVPCYISGLAGTSLDARAGEARRLVADGASAFKVFLSSTEEDCLAELDALRAALGPAPELYVDALWRLDPGRAVRFSRRLAERGVSWLEAPLVPEDVAGHARLARRSAVPIALGESYRTRYELLPFLERGAVAVLQPDVARCGITEARRIAALAGAFHVPLAPHVSVGLGPQLAAALHFAASLPSLERLEHNPRVHELASGFLRAPLLADLAGLRPPDTPGLGVEPDEAALAPYVLQ